MNLHVSQWRTGFQLKFPYERLSSLCKQYKDKSKLERDLRLCNLESVTHFVRSLTLFTGQNALANSGRMLSKVRLWWCRRYWLSEIELGKFHRSLVRRDFAEKRREQNFLPCITALWFWILRIKTFFSLSELSQYLPSFLSQNWLVGCYAIVTKMMMIEERPKFMNEIMSLEKQIALSTSRPRTSSDSRRKSQGKLMSAEFACGLFIPSLLDALGSLRLHALRLCLHYTG